MKRRFARFSAFRNTGRSSGAPCWLVGSGEVERNRGIPTLGLSRPRAEFLSSTFGRSRPKRLQNLLRESAPDYLMIVGWSELAPSAILDIPKSKHRGVARHTASYGCIGMHQTLLPEGRGRAPIPWAIIKGLNRTGVTAFLLEEAADAGGIVEQIQIPIDPTETATTLFDKARMAHIELGARLGKRMAMRALSWTDQDERLASTWPRRRPEDGRIDFSWTAVEIDRFVRALTPPYPGAFFLWANEKIRVHKVETLQLAHTEDPGTVLATNPSLIVAVKDAAIRFEVFERPRVPLVAGTILA